MQKTVVITGCSSGIGRVAAQDLQARGYRVIAACRKPEDVTQMRALGFIAVVLDLDDAQSIDRAADEILALTDNRLFALFNNGGFGLYGP
ncbi:MAG: SDR family NAD(P)-dependent oxidoreductase, partial [Pantoea piersonii]